LKQVRQQPPNLLDAYPREAPPPMPLSKAISGQTASIVLKVAVDSENRQRLRFGCWQQFASIDFDQAPMTNPRSTA
jgi:hypothetical protein